MNESSALPTRGGAVQGANPHPHTLSTLGSRMVGTGGLAPWWWGGNQPTLLRNLVEARAEGRPCDWVAELGAWGTSIVCQRRRKAILVVSSGEGNLPRQDCHLAGDAPSWAPRTTLCKTDIHSRPLWRRRTHWWGESCIDRRSRQKPFSRARVGHARSRAKRAPAKSSPRDRGAVPADLDVLWCLARAIEAARLPRGCVDDQASSLQRPNFQNFVSTNSGRARSAQWTRRPQARPTPPADGTPVVAPL